MMTATTLLAFVPAALALNFTPGADMMFCLGQGLRAGSRAAWAASAGVALGGMIHVTCAGLGVAAALTAVPQLFDLIRWLGVAYLLYLAWGALRHGAAVDAGAPVPPAQAFRHGLMVNLTNPKVILFVLAFVPQFVDPAAGPVLLQFLTFGAIIALGGLVVNGGVGHFAGQARRYLVGNANVSRWLGRVTGGIFAALALRLAILERT